MKKQIPTYFILRNGEPIPTDGATHADWMVNTPIEKKRIGITRLGNFEISTVFIGIYAHLDENSRPLIFETLVKKDGEDDLKRLYANSEEAEAGHREIVEKFQKRLKGN